jgi:enoyl-CoA hydratase/carnithine racemase
MSTDDGTVRYQRRGSVAHVVFDRPAARNALTWSMYEQLATALARLALDTGVRVAVLRGSGGTFVAGTDIRQFAAFAGGEAGVAYERILDDLIGTLERVRVPTIAVVEGHAAGAGLVIAGACDLRLCTPDARFGVPIARTVGNCLSMRNHARLVRHLGEARTRTLIFTAGFMSAQEARDRDFVLEVVPAEELESRVDDLCGRLVELAPLTLQATKEALLRLGSGEREGDDLVRQVYGSHDFREGVAAYLAGRTPVWRGQ